MTIHTQTIQMSPAPTILSKHFIVTKIQVVIYSKSYCPHCTNAKSLFSTNFPSVGVKIYELDKIPGGKEIQSTLQKMTGQRTVPNVWVGGNHLGGNDDTQAAFSSGSLARELS